MNRLCFLLISLCFGVQPVTASERPNVLFILSDNQSYYEMSCHGHAQLKTPHIDKFAKQSVEFSHFYAPPYCSPSRSVIMTGQYAMRNGVFTTVAGRSLLHRDAVTLPDLLRKQGYQTGIFGKWHLGFSYPYRPQDRGFDEVFVHGGGGVGQLEDYFGNTLFDTTFIRNGKVEGSTGYCTDTLFDEAMRFIDQSDSPFFCFVSTPVTHSPHHGPKELVEKLKANGVTGNVELFAQVQNLDSNIGRILDHLDANDLADNTIVIFASDQGMNDRGAPHGDNRLGLGFDPAHHVPFFLRVPGVKPSVTDRLAGMIDLFPTLLELCDASPAEDQSVDGLSLVPLLMSDRGEYPADRTLIIQCPRNRNATKWKNASVKTDRWRLVDGNQLFDIKADPRQSKDVAADHPQTVKRLRQEYETFWNDLPDPESTWSRHDLGAIDCPDVVLNAMDWYVGANPWNHTAFRGKANGAWAVNVRRDGRYRIECRHYPREANKPAEATDATLIIGDQSWETEVDASDPHATFEVDLKVGQFDLKTELTSAKGVRGALFVYVSFIDP